MNVKDPSESRGAIFRNMRRETRIILVFWFGMMLWVVGYCGSFAYETGGEMTLIMGFPSWVFWGIAVPWLVANLFTFWFCLFGMKDDPLEESESDSGEHHE